MTIFYLDLECDDLAGTTLLQIACMSDKNKIFNGFCTTTISLSQRCTQLTGFHTKEGKLFQHSKELKTHEKRHILESFNKWLSANTIGRISLVAHNGHGYDYRVLFKHFLSCELEIVPCVHYCDSLTSIRKLFGVLLPRCSLASLTERYGLNNSKPHNGLADCIVLKQICEKIISEHKLPSDYFIRNFKLQTDFGKNGRRAKQN